MPSLAGLPGVLVLDQEPAAGLGKAEQVVGHRDPGARLVGAVLLADPFQGPMHHDELAADLSRERGWHRGRRAADR